SVADAARFDELVSRLRLPVLRSPKSVAPSDASPPPAAGAPAPRADSRAATAEGAPSSFLPLDASQAMFDANDPAMVPLETEADASMRSLIGALRRSFGAGRLLQAGRWVKQSQAAAPAALAAQGEPIGVVYT